MQISNKYVSKAYSYKILKNKKVINDIFGSDKIVLFHKSGTASALDKRYISDSKDVGSTAVFSAVIKGEVLEFYYDKTEGIKDKKTNSLWDIFGKAVRGKLKGKELTQIVHADHFWFSWAAFKPDTIVYK